MAYHATKTPIEHRDSLETPDYLIHRIAGFYGAEVDLACSESNQKLPFGLVSEKYDSLSVRWADYGSIGFCNPPYSNISPWIEKAIVEATENDFETVFLIPTPNGDKWADLLKNASSIEFITGRISFIDPITRQPKNGNNRGSCIALICPVGLITKTPEMWFVNRKKIEDDYKDDVLRELQDEQS